MSDCSKAIATALGDETISESQATEILQRMENLAKARASERGLRVDEALKEVAGEMKAGDDSLRLIDRRNRLMSLAALKNQLETISNGKKLWGNALYDSMTRAYKNQQTFNAKFVASFAAKLDELGLTEIWRSQKYSKEFHLESWNPDKPVMEGELGNRIHEFMQFFLGERKQRNAMLNRKGTYYPEHDNYGFLQSYSTERLWNMGGKMDDGHKARTKEAFLTLVNAMKIDEANTYEGRDKAKFWNQVFENLYAGSHEKLQDKIDVDKFQGVHGSIANKLSESRLIWFKDAESQWQWNQAIGTGDYGEQMMHEMNRAARALAVMTEFGPNWKNTVEMIPRQLKAMATTIDESGNARPDSAKQVQSIDKLPLDAYTRILSGEADISRNPTASRWVKNAIIWTHNSKLGFATIASVGDMAMEHNQLMANGMGTLEAMGAMMNRIRDKKVLAGLDVASHDIIGSLNGRFGVGTYAGINGRISHVLHKVNFFNMWNDGIKGNTTTSLSWWLGEHSNLEFGKLPAGLQTELGRESITASDWEALRSIAQAAPSESAELAPSGRKFLFMDKLPEIDDSHIDRLVGEKGWKVTDANRARVRDDLEVKLGRYYSEQQAKAMNTPDLRTRYITTWGASQAGGFPREVANLLMVFKAFPITTALNWKQRAVEAGVFTNPANWGEGQWSFMGHQARLMAAMATAGYLAMTARDLLNGRTRRKLFDDNGNPNGSVFFDAIAKGGGLGIYGDFLFSEYDRQYKSALGALAGPVIGQLDPLTALTTNVRKQAFGEKPPEKPLAELFNMSVNNLPFGNLFYTRPILNALIFWNIREALSPGVLRRAEHNARGLNYQDFWLEPSAIGTIPISEPGRKLEQVGRAFAQ